jgi:hypothetical protein
VRNLVCDTTGRTLSVFENRVLRIFTLKRNEMVAGWKKLYNEDLHNWYSSPNTIRMVKLTRMRLAGHIGCMWNAYRILTVKPKGKRPLAGPRYKWEDIREIE